MYRTVITLMLLGTLSVAGCSTHGQPATPTDHVADSGRRRHLSNRAGP
jgi:hypothetical protein